MMNPQNGKGDKRLHARQQCSNEQMQSNWDKAMSPPKTKCSCKGMTETSGRCHYNSSIDNGDCFAPNTLECEYKVISE